MIDLIMYGSYGVFLVAMVLLVVSCSKKTGLRKKQNLLLPHVTTSPIYKPRWKKLKYYQKTKKRK